MLALARHAASATAAAGGRSTTLMAAAHCRRHLSYEIKKVGMFGLLSVVVCGVGVAARRPRALVWPDLEIDRPTTQSNAMHHAAGGCGGPGADGARHRARLGAGGLRGGGRGGQARGARRRQEAHRGEPQEAPFQGKWWDGASGSGMGRRLLLCVCVWPELPPHSQSPPPVTHMHTRPPHSRWRRAR